MQSYGEGIKNKTTRAQRKCENLVRLTVAGDRWLLSAGTHTLPVAAPSLSAGLATGYMDYYTHSCKETCKSTHTYEHTFSFGVATYTQTHIHTHTSASLLLNPLPPLRSCCACVCVHVWRLLEGGVSVECVCRGGL